MIILQYVLVCIVTMLIVFMYFHLKKKGNDDAIDSSFKVIALTLALVFFVRYMSGEDLIRDVVSLNTKVIDGKFLTFVSLISNWFFYANILLVCLGAFNRFKTVTNILKFFTLPITLISLFALIPMCYGIVGKQAYLDFNFRAILMALEMGMVLGYALITWFENPSFKLTKKEALGFLYIIPMLLSVMPSYMVIGLFGKSNSILEVKSFSATHRYILYLSLIIPITIYLILNKKSYEEKRFCLLFISLGTLMSFSLGHKFASFLNITQWPVHLCNTAMYIVPLCLFFKWDKLFYFTYFINVLGAFLAMAMPNYSAELNLYAASLVNFYINHYIAFFMPILIIALRLYERPRMKTFMYSMIGFAVYFLLVLILNAWFSNYGNVDYFFINSDFIADKLGNWALDLRNTTLEFDINGLHFVFYPVYQLLFFLTYVALGFGMWFIYEQGYAFADMLRDINARNKKIKADWLALEVAKAERIEKMSKEQLKEIENSIVLYDFSKRYGTSKNFAVKDANLKISGGEVFGFLGHNGAGKSTIIKSIVGIQPITEGRIEVCGFDVEKESVMAKRMIGFVPDHYALYEKLTGREYLNYIADLWNVSQEDRDKSIEKYSKLFEMEVALENQIKTYSHGMKQKITIMSALVHNPKVWILDEPLTGLDPTSIFQVKECMKQHAKEGNIVFFSSHLIDVVESICDKIAIIKKGKILTTKSVKEIEKECSLEEFYLETIGQDLPKEEIERQEKNRLISDKVEKEYSEKRKKSNKKNLEVTN